ncbi:hypothetical protein D3C80_2050750 [compost metagenome]
MIVHCHTVLPKTHTIHRLTRSRPHLTIPRPRALDNQQRFNGSLFTAFDYPVFGFHSDGGHVRRVSGISGAGRAVAARYGDDGQHRRADR